MYAFVHDVLEHISVDAVKDRIRLLVEKDYGNCLNVMDVICNKDDK